MVGLINQAIEDMICSHYGEARWHEIKREANIDTDVFLSMDAYPDEMTYNIMKATVHTLGLREDEVLEAFGEHCVAYSNRIGYARMFCLCGDSLRSFLLNWDVFYSRMAMAFAELKPLSFSCAEVRADALKLHYKTIQPGFPYLVIGVLKGMARFFETSVEITHIARKERGIVCDEFLISFV